MNELTGMRIRRLRDSQRQAIMFAANRDVAEHGGRLHDGSLAGWRFHRFQAVSRNAIRGSVPRRTKNFRDRSLAAIPEVRHG